MKIESSDDVQPRRRAGQHLSAIERAVVRYCRFSGLSLAKVGELAGCSTLTVHRLCRETGTKPYVIELDYGLGDEQYKARFKAQYDEQHKTAQQHIGAALAEEVGIEADSPAAEALTLIAFQKYFALRHANH